MHFSKKTFTHSFFACFSLVYSAVSLANVQVSTDYNYWSDGNAGLDLGYNLVSLSLKYTYPLDSKWKVAPAISLGRGIVTESSSNSLPSTFAGVTNNNASIFIESEVDHLLLASVNVEYHFDSQFYLYGSLSHLDVDISGAIQSDDQMIGLDLENRDSFGLGLGLGYASSDKLTGEIDAQRFGTDDLLSISIGYRF